MDSGPCGTTLDRYEVEQLLAPAPDNKGSEEVARCVAARIKEHSRPWPDGTSGILVLVVFLPART